MSSAPGSSCVSVPVEHLDYSFIQSCSDLKHLEQILRVLRSGQEGFYPHLIDFCERRVEKLNPRSAVLRKENRPASAACFSSEEWRRISEDLQMWESSVRVSEAELKRSPIFSDVDNVPPVRSSNTPVQTSTSAAVENAKSSCVPRAFRDWDRFDVETECVKVDEGNKNTLHTAVRPDRPELAPAVDGTCPLTPQEKQVFALREKDKGNEAFRSGDYEEAVAYYSRSLSLASSAAAFNNRAQAHIRRQCWTAALSDCEAALQLQPHNVKALLRRATAHKRLGHLQESHDDLRAVLRIEPRNATALKLLDETCTDQRQDRCSTGRKILIQEVDEEEEDEEAQDESREDKHDISRAEIGIMGNTHKMLSCADGLNELTDSSGGDGSDDAPAGAPPHGHGHLMNAAQGDTEERHTQAPAEHTEFELLKDDGKALFQSGCYQEAVDRYTQCLQLKPHACAIYTNRALCFIKLQLFTEARQDCDSVLQTEPTNKKALYIRALANKALKDYLMCCADLQQVLRLDASVSEAQQLLMEVTRLMKDRRRRSIRITEVEDEEDEDADAAHRPCADAPAVVLQPCNAYEFGQALSAARCYDNLLTCAELLRRVASERLPEYISTQLDAHTVSFIIRAMNAHLLHTHPELVFEHLQQLRSARRLTTVLMLMGPEERSQLSQLFQTLHALQTEAFSPDDVTNLANKYI